MELINLHSIGCTVENYNKVTVVNKNKKTKTSCVLQTPLTDDVASFYKPQIEEWTPEKIGAF